MSVIPAAGNGAAGAMAETQMGGSAPVLPSEVRTGAAGGETAGVPAAPRGLWYLAMPGTRLRRGTAVHRTLLDEPVLIGRDRAGKVFALRDICPHRAMPLSAGRFDGETVTCAYHGWQFGADGVCRNIPSLVEETAKNVRLDRIGVKSYPCREAQHLVWVYMGDDAAPGDADLPAPPEIPARGRPGIAETLDLECHFDDAVIGLIDPAHGAYVHRNWWWRSSKTLTEKAKRYAPSELGFTMVRHAPSANSRIIRLLRGEKTVEISFRLPGVRVEHMTLGDRHHYVGVTAMTPVSEYRTAMHHVMYWSHPLMTLAKPIAVPVTRNFLNQDRTAMNLQREGRKKSDAAMLLPDADTPAKWYMALKKELAAARAEGRDFRNPVTETVLRWRS